jgi:hypothetical protein
MAKIDTKPWARKVLVLSLIGTAKAGVAGSPVNPEIWQTVLSASVTSDGGVDYQAVRKNEAKLDEFLKSYSDYNFTGVSENRKKADYINLYNAGMIKNILRYASDKKIEVGSPEFTKLNIQKLDLPSGNIWNGTYFLKFAGKEVSLDDVEHRLIRGVKAKDLEPFAVKGLDPRIHAAVNCAAMSCPRVRETAYLENTVDSMLEQNIREFMSSGNQFSKVSDDKMKANSIVFWYYSDFDEFARDKMSVGGAGSYLSRFISPTASDSAWKIAHFKKNFDNRSRLALKVLSEFDFDYDWTINDVRNKKKGS